MARVMFHCICDQCGKHGPEYEFFPRCRECGDEVCLECATDVNSDGDVIDGNWHYTYDCLCSRCASDSLASFERIAERLTEWTPDALSVRAEIDATCREMRRSQD